MIVASRRQIAEKLLWLDGNRFSLDDYPMYDALYRGTWRQTLMKCGRQVGKSVSAAAHTVVDAISTPYFRTLYVSPSLKQTSTFSNTRVAKMLRHSPHVRDNFLDPTAPDNVFLKILANGSELIFTYASDDPDRARGYSADRINFDEIQDILYDEVVPVIAECAANSNYGYFGYTGTPKTMENTIEYMWRASTQTEWCIKCDACGSYSYYVSDQGIGKNGILCLKCKAYVNARNGIWVDMNPIPEDTEEDSADAQRVKGFHIPQLILPRNTEIPSRWGRIIQKLEDYSPSDFKNEVLGVSDAIGARLISLEEVQACCDPHTLDIAPTTPKLPPGLTNIVHVVGGVDWSGGGTGGHSRTVAWLWGIDGGGRHHTLWFKIFPVVNPVDTVDEIARVFGLFNVNLVFGDAGEGHLGNNLLTKHLGPQRVWQVQYSGNEGGGFHLKWNGKDRYMADRTTMIDNFLYNAKMGLFRYPNLKQSSPVFEDMMSVYEEVTVTGRRVWRHAPSNPDDALHAQVFAWLAGKVRRNDLSFYSANPHSSLVAG